MKLRVWKVKQDCVLFALVLKHSDSCWHANATDSFMLSGPQTNTPILDPPLSFWSLLNISVQFKAFKLSIVLSICIRNSK